MVKLFSENKVYSLSYNYLKVKFLGIFSRNILMLIWSSTGTKNGWLYY